MKSAKYMRSLINILFGASVFFGLCGTISADPNPPGSMTGERLSGPAMIGDMTFTGLTMSFVGQCKGAEVILPAVDQSINLGLADDVIIGQIEGSRFDINVANLFLPEGCAPDTAVDVIVNTVIKFTNLGTTATAKVVLMFVVPAI